MDLLVRNGTVITCGAGDRQPRKAHVVIRDGTIEAVTPQPPPPSRRFARVIEAAGKIVMPGLVNAHMHSYANLTRTLSGTTPLEVWMLSVMAVGRLFEPEDNRVGALLGAAEMLKSGTTTCLDHLAQGGEGLEAAMRAYEESGMRACLAPMIGDRPYFDTLPLDPRQVPVRFLAAPSPRAEELVDTTLALHRRWHGRDGRLRVLFGPSGPQRCSDELLRRCAELARELDTGWHTHVLETRIQADTGCRMYGRPMVRHLEQLGILSGRASFAHGVWLSEEESRLAAERGVTVVHNPASNLRLGSGTAPVPRYRSHGVTVALGTDGVNCGGSLSMFESLRLAAILHNPAEPDPRRWIRSDEALAMATRHGARALGLEGRVGSIEQGLQADLVILDPARSPALVPLRDAADQVVYGEQGHGVETVLVQGKVLVEDGRIVSFDEGAVRREAERRAELLLARYARGKAAVEEQESFLRQALWGEPGRA